jgi:membrane-associated protease RseP (regulator of RpoE activity)
VQTLRPILAVLLLGTLAAAQPTAQPPAADAAAEAVAVPFERLKTGHMAVSIKLNGKGPYRVLFDTGAPVTVVGTSVARESGVLGKDAKQPALGLFGAMGQHPIRVLELGGLKAEKVPAIVLDHPAVAALAKNDGPLDGILGYPFFARYRMTLDYQAKTLTFRPGDYEPEDILQSLMNTLGSGKKPPPRIVAPAALWGFVAAKKADDDAAGVTIDKVLDGSPSAAAGLEAGDRLLTLDGRWTDSVEDVYVATAAVKADSAVTAVVLRKGKEQKLTITPKPGL